MNILAQGLNVTNGQVIKTEREQSQQQHNILMEMQINLIAIKQQQTFTFDNIVYNTTSKVFCFKNKKTEIFFFLSCTESTNV